MKHFLKAEKSPYIKIFYEYKLRKIHQLLNKLVHTYSTMHKV